MDGLERALIYQNALCHHGVEGMKWYERRYQNKDGSLTEEGRKHYGVGKRELKQARKDAHYASYAYQQSKIRTANAQRKYDKNQKSEKNKLELERSLYAGQQIANDLITTVNRYKKINQDVIDAFGKTAGDDINYSDDDGYTVVTGSYRTPSEKAAILGAVILGGITVSPVGGAVAYAMSSETGMKQQNYQEIKKMYDKEYDKRHANDTKGYSK